MSEEGGVEKRGRDRYEGDREWENVGKGKPCEGNRKKKREDKGDEKRNRGVEMGEEGDKKGFKKKGGKGIGEEKKGGTPHPKTPRTIYVPREELCFLTRSSHPCELV